MGMKFASKFMGPLMVQSKFFNLVQGTLDLGSLWASCPQLWGLSGFQGQGLYEGCQKGLGGVYVMCLRLWFFEAGIVPFASVSVLARVRLCMWLTVWGRAVLAAGESIFYFHILGIKEGVACDSGGLLGELSWLCKIVQMIRCEIASVGGMGELI
eukprot:1144146-Pelagomonas_calceolata.AAC.2